MAKKQISSKKAPDKLSVEAQGIWTDVAAGWQLASAAFVLLGIGLEAFDEMRQAQSILTADGPIVRDRFGVPKQHPACLVLRDSRNAALKCFRQLSLDIESILRKD